MKLIDEICSHMIEIKKPKGYWTKEKCREEALKYYNRTDFCKNSNGCYYKSYNNNWLDEICSHMIVIGNKYKRCIYAYEFDETKTVYVGLTYSTENRNAQHLKHGPVYNYRQMSKKIPTFKQLTNYIHIDEAKLEEGNYLAHYKKEGWNILNKIKTGALGGGTRKWTKEKCIEDAKQYKNKADYRKNSTGYRAVVRNKWLDDIYFS